MTQVLIDRATLEQLVVALEDSIDCARHEYETYWGHGLPTRKAQIDRMKESLDQHEASITALRAALANAEPTWWQKIETAPKDYVTEFDGWNGDRVPNVSWAHPEYSSKGHYAWCVSEYEHHNGWVNTEVKGLTHWMPLPAEPKEQS